MGGSGVPTYFLASALDLVGLSRGGSRARPEILAPLGSWACRSTPPARHPTTRLVPWQIAMPTILLRVLLEYIHHYYDSPLHKTL